MRAGVIGLGNMGRHHARIYKEMKDVDLVALADVNLTPMLEFDACGISKYTDWKMMLENEKLDMVSIVTPTSTHYEIAGYCITEGLNVLIEKPVAMDLRQADSLIKLRESFKGTKPVAMVGHVERFNPVVRKLRDLIYDGALGTVISLSSKRVGPQPKTQDVGVTLDIGIHDIDLAMYLLEGTVDDVYTVSGKIKHPIEDHAMINLRLGGASAFIQVNWLTPYKMRRLQIIGTEGVAEADLMEQTLLVYSKEGVMNYTIAKTEPLKTELEHFVRSIGQGANISPTLYEGRKALAVALASLESAKRNEVLGIDDIEEDV